jgi:hypothetical protein
MADALRIVPVVAHRIYGTRIEETRTRPRRRPLPFAADPGGDRLPGPRIVVPAIDTGVGTTVTLEEVRAFFTPDPALGFTGGFTVNALFPRLLRFNLIETIDHMVESDLADFLPALGTHERFDRPGVLNLYCVRELEGANGWARHGAAYVADRLGEEALGGREGRWRRQVITLAHEFGHVLSLRHVTFIENTMFGYGVEPGSLEFNLPQLRIMHHAARFIASEAPIVAAPPHLVADWARDRPFAAWAAESREVPR